MTLAPLAVVVALVSLVLARAAIRSRQEMRSPGTWPRIYRELSRKQRASVRRALRNGRAVDDPSLAYAVVTAARYLRRHGPKPGQRLLNVAVGVISLAVSAFLGWHAATVPRNRPMLLSIAVLQLVVGLQLIALLPVSLRQAKRAAEAERANQAPLDGS